MPGLKIFQAIDQIPEMIDPTTGLVKPKDVDLSVSEKQNFNNENVSHIRYDKGFLFDKAKDLQDENIALGSNPEAVNEILAERQSNLTATKNAIGKFVGKTAITVGDTIIGGLVSIPDAIINGDMTKLYDNDFHRWMDKQAENLDNALPIYQTKAQEQEGFFSKLNNAKFWGDGVMQGMSFTVGAVLSEMALSYLTGLTGGTTAEVQAAETANLISKAKKIFSLFGKDATKAELKALSKDVIKSLAVGAGYEAGVEARNFLDTARKNYIEQYKSQYGVEPDANTLANADLDIKKTANLIFGANMALLSVDNFVQFKNIFGNGISTDLKLFGKDTIKKEVTKDFALRGALEAGYESASKARKALYTTAKVLKNPLTEMNEEALQGEFQAIGQDYIKKKFDATAYDDSFSLIDSFSKNFKDTYGSEDAGIGFIIGAMGIPGMGIATGKTKNVKGFGNKVIASFEGGIAEAFEEQSQEKQAIKSAISQASKVNIDNVQSQIQSNSAIYTSNQQRDEALANGDFFEAKNHESDALFSFVKSRDNVGLLNESKEQYATMIKEMDNADFAKQFGYDKLNANEKALSDEEISQRKKNVIEAFNKKINNFQETKELASKVAPVKNFNDKDARLFNEAIHHLMYTTNDLDSREDSLVKIINDKLAKSKNDSVNNDKLKELMSFHNTWFNLSDKTISKELKAYTKELKILTEMDALSIEDETDLTERKNKSKAKLSSLRKTIQSKLDEINNSKDKLSKLGFNITNNFENVDNFTNAHNEFKQLQKDIENHLGQNVFDKDTIKQSIDDLAKIQSRRKDLIGTYNELNTKNGREKFDKEVKKNERNAKIEFLKIQARKFLHNQGLELDKDTVKEIENNVDLQVKETDSPEVKAQKQAIKSYSDNIDNQNDIVELTNLVEYLKQFKEGIDDSLKTYVDILIVKAKDKIKELQQTKKEVENQKKEDGKKPYFSNINELFSLFNNEQQKNKLASIANDPDEKDLRKRITFTLTDLENPKSIEQAVADLKEKDNQNVISLSGVRGNNKPFNFQMKVDGELIGGFQMPNQIYLKINNKWSQIDFTKLKEDDYLITVLEMLFPSDLISTIEDRKLLGQYLIELNSFSNKLSTITQRGDISFEDFNNLTSGQINLNAFASQIEMNFTDDKDKDGNIIETKIEDILDDPDNVLTKAATKTIKVNGEDKNIVIFGKSTGDGQGFSKLYFVNIINGKLERNQEGAVLWRDRDDKENSEERKAIQNLVKNKEKAINTKGSLFSLLVFNSNGYIQPIFTSNETISKLKGLDKNEEFIINFLNNERALQPALQIISNGLSSYYEEHKDKTKDEFTNDDIKNFDLFLSVTGLNKTKKVKIIPFISTYSDKIGQLSFNLEINKKDNIIASSIYFDGQNFFKSFAKGKEELKPINEKFEKGEITLSQKIEEIKKFRHEVLNENKLNEEIASLILKDSQYSVLGKLRKETTVNATINGFYTNVLLNKNNQQSLENLVTKKKLGYNLYLRPDRTQVKEIISTKRNIELRNEKQQEEVNQQQKAKEEIQNKEQEDLFKENTVKLEAQGEGKTVREVIANNPTPSVSNSDVTNANTAALSNLMNTSSIINEELLKQAAKNIGLPAFIANSTDRLKTALTTNEKLKAEYDRLNPQPIEVVDKKADTERRRQEDLETTKNIGEDKLKEGRENTKKLVESLKQRYPATSVQGIIIRILEKLIDFSKYSTIIDSDYLNGRNASGQATWFGMIISQETFDGILAGKEFEVHTFIHEFIHGFTTSKISDYNIEKQGLIPGFKSKLTAKEKNAIEQLQRIFEKVKKDNPTSKEYGFTNLDEFIAEAFSNTSFQYTLKNTKAEGKKSNLFSEFIEAIGDLLFEQLERWAKRFNKETPERSTITGILEDVLAWTEDLIDQNNKLAYIATNEEINAKYDAELKALEQQSTTKTPSISKEEHIERISNTLYHQGAKSEFDNRDINYFTESKEEAGNYGSNVRSLHIVPTNPYIFYEERNKDNNLEEEFNKDNPRFDILDNSSEGLQNQEKFFKFIKSKGYDLVDLYVPGSDESLYVVSLDNNILKEELKEEIITNEEPLILNEDISEDYIDEEIPEDNASTYNDVDSNSEPDADDKLPRIKYETVYTTTGQTVKKREDDPFKDEIKEITKGERTIIAKVLSDNKYDRTIDEIIQDMNDPTSLISIMLNNKQAELVIMKDNKEWFKERGIPLKDKDKDGNLVDVQEGAVIGLRGTFGSKKLITLSDLGKGKTNIPVIFTLNLTRFKSHMSESATVYEEKYGENPTARYNTEQAKLEAIRDEVINNNAEYPIQLERSTSGLYEIAKHKNRYYPYNIKQFLGDFTISIDYDTSKETLGYVYVALDSNPNFKFAASKSKLDDVTLPNGEKAIDYIVNKINVPFKDNNNITKVVESIKSLVYLPDHLISEYNGQIIVVLKDDVSKELTQDELRKLLLTKRIRVDNNKIKGKGQLILFDSEVNPTKQDYLPFIKEQLETSILPVIDNGELMIKGFNSYFDFSFKEIQNKPSEATKKEDKSLKEQEQDAMAALMNTVKQDVNKKNFNVNPVNPKDNLSKDIKC